MRHTKRPMVIVVLGGLAAALLVATAVGAASPTPIDDIVTSPDSYEGEQVTVVGMVTSPSVTLRGESIYMLLGQTRTLSVISRASAPSAGERLQVSGRIGRPDEEDTGFPSFPPTLLESDRQPAP